MGFNKIRNNVVNNFTKDPNSKLTRLYKEMNKTYTDNLEPLALAKSINKAKFLGTASPEAGLNNLYTKLTGSGKVANDFQRNWQKMSQFFTDNNISSGKKLVDEIRWTEAAKYYSANTPAIQNLAGPAVLAAQAGVAAGAVFAGEELDSPALTGLGLLAGAGISPRLNRRINKAALKTPSYLSGAAAQSMINMKDIVGTMGESTRRQLLNDPQQLIRVLTSSMTPEQAEEFTSQLESNQ